MRTILRPALAAAALAAALSAACGAPAQDMGQTPPAPTYPAPDQTPAPDAGPSAMPGAAGRPAPSPQMLAARRAMRQACAADIAKLCSDAEPGGRGMMQCVRSHAADLSPGCRQAMGAMRDARRGQAAPSGAAPSGAPAAEPDA